MLQVPRLLVGAVLFVGACGGAATSAPASSPSSDRPNDAPSSASTPSDVGPAPPAIEVDCGDFSSCAISTDGLARCWGRGKEGELGDAAAKDQSNKRSVIPGLGKVKKIALASQIGCAILDDKKVKCWGTGRIANDGKAVEDSKPTLVANVEDAEELEASGAIVCARGGKGIACWGADEKTIGTPPKGTSWKQITTGFSHACAIDDKGLVACWGTGDWAPTGLYGKPGITGARAIVTGDRHGCVITKDKTVQCWGMNDAGQLGMKSDIDPHKKPITVPGIKGAVKLFAGEAANCAVLEDGSTRCWGSNGEGELGLGSRSSDERPGAVSGLSNVDHVCFASAHACALTKEQKLYCWGANAFGQIGDGTKERRLSPTAVAW